MRTFAYSPSLRFIILILFIAGIVFASIQFNIDQERIDSFFEGVPFGFASFAFIALYIFGTFAIWYLKDPLKVIGAVIFGAYVSALYIYIAEIINATIFFSISKALGKDFLETQRGGRFGNFYRKLEGISLGWIFLLRIVPLIPYRVLDLSFGLSKVPFRKYMIAVLLASLPRIFWIQFICAGLKEFSVEGVVGYFSHNSMVFSASFIYCIGAIVAVAKIRNRFR